MKIKVNSYDYDGTLTTGAFAPVVGQDIILTGRCYNEAKQVFDGLKKLGIENIPIFFNPMHYSVRGDFTEEARLKSAAHKVDILSKLSVDYDVTHWDDDHIQLAYIQKHVPTVKLIQVENPNQNFYGEQNE